MTLPSGLPLPQHGPHCLCSTRDISLTTPSLHRKFIALSKLLSESLQDEYMKSMNGQISSIPTRFHPHSLDEITFPKPTEGISWAAAHSGQSHPDATSVRATWIIRPQITQGQEGLQRRTTVFT